MISNKIMYSLAASALLMFSTSAYAYQFTTDNPDIDETWLGAEVSVDFGANDSIHDRDGTLYYEDDVAGGNGHGYLLADIVSNSAATMKAKALWTCHDSSAFGGDNPYSNFAVSTQSVKPFTIAGTGTQNVTMSFNIDGLLAVDEGSTDANAFSRAVMEYLVEIQTVGSDGTRVETYGSDGEINAVEGYVLAEQYGGGAAATAYAPDQIPANDMEPEPYDNPWAHEDAAGLTIREVTTSGGTNDATHIAIDNAEWDGTATEAAATTYVTAGRSTFYVDYTSTFNFDAVAGQQYFVAMDLFAGIRVSFLEDSSDNSVNGWAVSDFSNTIVYALSGGDGVVTDVIINGDGQHVEANNQFGGSSVNLTLDDATLTFDADYNIGERVQLASGTDNNLNSNGHAGVVSGAIYGSGNLIKEGAGSLTLTGANTYTGETEITAGTLALGADNTLPSTASVNVASGAIFDVNDHLQTIGEIGGIGTVDLGTGTLTVSGATTPGNSIGTLTVTGAGVYAQSADSEMEVEFQEDGAVDLLDVTAGSVNIAAGAKLVPVAFNNVVTSQTYTFIQTAGGITGTFDIEDNYAIYDFAASVVNGGNDYQLTVTRQSYASALAAGSVASGVASTLDSIFAGAPTAEMQSLMDSLDAMDPSEINEAYEQLLPDVTGASTMMANAVTGQIQGVVGGRLGSVRSGVSSGDASVDKNAWLQSFYGKADQENRKGYNGYEADNYGFAAGIDGEFSPDLTVGIALGYGNTDSNSANSKLDVDSSSFMVYGSYNLKKFYVDAMASYGVGDYESKRTTASGTAVGSYDGDQFAIRADVGIPANDIGVLSSTYVVTARYSNVSLDGYQETGAPGANLTVAEQSSDTLTVGAGIKLGKELKQTDLTLKPEIRAGVTYDVVQDDVTSVARFVSGGGAFSTKGLTPARAALELGGDLTFSRNDGLDIVVNYDGEYRDDYSSHTGLIRLKQAF